MAGDASQDRVGVAMRRSQPDSDDVEIDCAHGTNSPAVLGVVAGGEHLAGVQRNRHVASRRPLQHGLETTRVRVKDQHRLDQQGQILTVVGVAVGLTYRIVARGRDPSL